MGVSLVNFEFGGDASKAHGELRRLADANKALEQSLNRMTKASVDSSKAVQAALRSQSARIVDLVDKNEKLKNKIEEQKKKIAELDGTSKTTYGRMAELIGSMGIVGIIQKAIAAQKEWTSHIKETARAQDEVGRKFQIQSLQGDTAFQETLRRRILPAAMKSAIPLAQVQEVATEMVSKGFSIEQATGGALEEILIGAKANNVGDYKAFATAISSYLKSQGRELTGANVRGVTAPLTALFQGTAFQGGDLQAIAGVGSLLRQMGLKQDEMFSAVTTLKDVGGMDVGEATTGVRNIALILATARGNKKRLDAINRLAADSLGFEGKIDLVGETFGQSLANLRNMTAGVTPESRNTALGRIFGSENVAAAVTLMSNLETYQKYRAIQRDTSKFETGAALALGGPSAALTRLELERQFAEIEEGRKKLEGSKFREALRAEEIKAGIHPLQRAQREATRSSLSALGFDVQAIETGDSWFSAGESFGADDKARARAALARARAAGQTPELAQIAVDPGGPIETLPGAPVVTGPLRDVNFGKVPKAPKRKSPEDLALDAKALELAQAENALKRARYEADEDGALSRAEKERIHALDRVVKGLELVLGEMKNQKTERALQGEQDKGAAIPDVNRAANQ